MEALTATVRTVRSFPSNGGGLWCLILADNPPGVTVAGNFRKEPRPGETYNLMGEWSTHPKYGKQFKVETCALIEPQDVYGLRTYIQENLPHLGPAASRQAVQLFGRDILTVIENDHEKLTHVKGITKERASEIHEKYMDLKADSDFGLFCAQFAIRPRMQARILRDMLLTFKNVNRIMGAIRQNPFVLSEYVDGIGFKKADMIARSIGLSLAHPRRIVAGMIYALKDAAQSEGHCYLPIPEFIKRSKDLLGVEEGLIKSLVAEAGDKITIEGQNVFLSKILEMENDISNYLFDLLSREQFDVGRAALADDEWDTLDSDQKAAVEMAMQQMVMIVTGGPGVGKTYTINKILKMLQAGYSNIRLAAPTGKAAKRMSEACNFPACTMHRLLEWSPSINDFQRNPRSPIDAHAIILDEVSMVDIGLMHSFIGAVSPGTKLIMVGDRDQLPSVGPGSVLNDLIESGRIPVAHLQTLHRQAAVSLINTNAKLINAGKVPKWEKIQEDVPPDMYWIENEDPFVVQQYIVQAARRAHQHFGYSLPEIQILCPQKKGAIGVADLNEVLRSQVFNPDGEEIKGTGFRIGDKVLQTKNNYNLGVFNGEIGIILKTEINEDKQVEVLIEYEQIGGPNIIRYSTSDIDEITLAYAITVHKSQGSEFACVIMPVHTQNYIMLKRNLLYTGITRGKKLVVCIGMSKALKIAVETIDGRTRFTSLDEKIQKAVKPTPTNQGE